MISDLNQLNNFKGSNVKTISMSKVGCFGDRCTVFNLINNDQQMYE